MGFLLNGLSVKTCKNMLWFLGKGLSVKTRCGFLNKGLSVKTRCGFLIKGCLFKTRCGFLFNWICGRHLALYRL